jgi:hypothetical protein
MRALLVAVALAGCAAPPRAVLIPQVPASLQVCPDDVYAPPPPPVPRTVEQLVKWASAIEVARERTEAARQDCARTLGRLNVWINNARGS